MNDLLDVRAVLDATANQILAVVAPDTARLVRAYVTLDENAETAATDGVHIWVPPLFEGVDVTHDTPVAVGLLVHELGHFLQPLKLLDEVEKQAGAPHWLGNIVADVQLEAMMAGLFPPLADTLVAVRRTVKATRINEYTAAILQGRTLPDVACSAALAGRFGRPEGPFDDRAEASSPFWGTLSQQSDPALAARLTAFAWRLNEAQSLAAKELPAYIDQMMAEFPELRGAPERHPLPGGGLSVTGPAGSAAQGEASANTGMHPPTPPQPIVARVTRGAADAAGRRAGHRGRGRSCGWHRGPGARRDLAPNDCPRGCQHAAARRHRAGPAVVQQAARRQDHCGDDA